MEQFKVCEKETKTKKFSKEGLAREAEVRIEGRAVSVSRVLRPCRFLSVLGRGVRTEVFPGGWPPWGGVSGCLTTVVSM